MPTKTRFRSLKRIGFAASLLAAFSPILNAQATEEPGHNVLREGPIVEVQSGSFELDERIEPGRRVKAAESLGVLGSDLFGDSISFSTGGLSFSVTDIDLPGNNALPVRLTRTLSAGTAEGPTAPAQLGPWELDLPHMSGIYGTGSGWRVKGNEPFRRCSAATNEPPPWSTGAGTFGASEYWRGNSVSIPGEGKKLLLRRATENAVAPSDGLIYPYVAQGHWQFRCIPSIQNGEGEGFVGISPEGVSYRFDWVASRRYSTVQRSYVQNVGTPQLRREEVRLYATRVQDRYGNWVELDYAPNSDQVTAIRANDGRHISLFYNSDSGTLREAWAGGKVWRYQYSGSRFLTRVTRPDLSEWEIDTQPLVFVYDSMPGGPTCALPPWNSAIVPKNLRFKHPSGAVGEFELSPMRFARNSVPRDMACRVDVDGRRLEDGVAKQFDGYALTRKTISGPELGTLTTRVSYSTADVNSDRRTVTITHPDNSREFQVFSTVFNVSDGMLLERVISTASGQEPLREIYTYQTNPTGMPYPPILGYSGQIVADEFRDARLVPIKSRIVYQSGASFSWQALAYNRWALPTEVQRSSSLGYSKAELLAYRDLPAMWVLNQFVNRRDRELGFAEEIHFYVQSQINRIVKFGMPDYRRWYHTDGTLQQAASLSGAVVTLSDYYRGVPRQVTHGADNSTLRATVDDLGQIRSITDPLANTTNYAYDPMGRLTQTRFPSGDSTPWNDENTAYKVLTVADIEYGIPAGLWKRTHTRGRYEHVTWYDALWRPILTRERDISEPAKARFVRTAYDLRGNVSFQSYPSALADGVAYTSLNQGVSRSYDVLNRLTEERRSSELGSDLVSRTEYLSGFQVRTTNARNQSTTTRFMAYDEPTYDWPLRIDEPEYKVTTIDRDRWGKPTRITRQGWYQSPQGGWEQNFATRSFVYDVNQRLCKRIDPESGATIFDYDSFNRLAWTADGQNLLSTTSCDRESVAASQRVLRSYNAKDELIGIDYPDSSDDIAFTYALDGKLQSANVGPMGSQISRSYSYNKRRLPIQEQLLVDGQSFTLGYRYTGEGAVSELGYPDGSWEALQPDGLGRPSQMGQFADMVTWHHFGPLDSFRYGNGMSFTQKLNARGLPSERSDSWYGTPRLRETYSWDGNGNLTRILDQVGNAAQFSSANRWLTYDGLDRLTVADSPSQTVRRSQWGYSWGRATYAYDGLDNMRHHTMGGVIDFTYSYSPQGHLGTVTQPDGNLITSYAHNARGQMIRRTFQGENFNLSWDTAHRVTQTWNDAFSKVESYRYDAHGHRARTVRGGETLYQVYSQAGDLMWERSSTGTTRKYARLGGRLIGEVENGVRRAIHTDAIGSVRHKTDQFGTQVYEDVRAPYGSQLLGGSYQNGPAFTGHMEDGATGLTYMKARYYDPVAMRFISPDPVYVDLGTGGNFNRYWYANNNPYSYVDPDGRLAWFVVVPAVISLMTMSDYAQAPDIGEAPTVMTNGERVMAVADAVPLSRPFQVARMAAKSGGDVHGNSRSSSREQHRYEIRDTTTGDVKKTGISGRELNQDGSSPRANGQVNSLNREAGQDRYSAEVKETGLPGRQAGLDAERSATAQLKAEGHSLEFQKRPNPNNL
jgi:RHS repeat-associated protein